MLLPCTPCAQTGVESLWELLVGMKLATDLLTFRIGVLLSILMARVQLFSFLLLEPVRSPFSCVLLPDASAGRPTLHRLLVREGHCGVTCKGGVTGVGSVARLSILGNGR